MANVLPGTEQLSFSFGARAIRRQPEQSAFRLPQVFSTQQQLNVGAKVMVQVVDEDGDVLMSAYAECTAVGFKKHRATSGMRRAWYERIHTLDLDPEQL
jgi:hypothetical protein